jgi:integrase
MGETHKILGDKVRIYRRETGNNWFCAAYIAGKNRRKSTKEDSLSRAKEIAEDWYFDLLDKKRSGDILSEHTFDDAAQKFMNEYEVLTEGERNERWVKDHYRRIKMHLIPYFGDMGLSTINAGTLQEYRIHRANNPGTDERGKEKKPPSRSTLHHETVTLRMVLKTAVRSGWLQYVPDLSQPYKSSGKVVHRAWFSPDEYKQLYEATRENIKQAKGTRQTYLAEQLHDKILFMANTGIRPDEANWLEYRDIDIVDDKDTDETILEIEVRGKRGVGFCKSTKGAVWPFKRMVKRNKPNPTDRLFSVDHKKQFNRILEELNLKVDRNGNSRTLYSLRHSYISFRLLEGADIYQIAKNCRTSVEMIEKHYAVHLKNSLDARAINVRRGR